MQGYHGVLPAILKVWRIMKPETVCNYLQEQIGTNSYSIVMIFDYNLKDCSSAKELGATYESRNTVRLLNNVRSTNSLDISRSRSTDPAQFFSLSCFLCLRNLLPITITSNCLIENFHLLNYLLLIKLLSWWHTNFARVNIGAKTLLSVTVTNRPPSPFVLPKSHDHITMTHTISQINYNLLTFSNLDLLCHLISSEIIWQRDSQNATRNLFVLDDWDHCFLRY